MLRPDVFGALATHAGDALYELCYVPEFGAVVRALRAYDGDPARWWADFTSRTAFTKPEDDVLLGIYGVAACFSAEPDGTPVLPFDPVTGVLRPEVWQRWLDLDPVRMAPRARRRAALPAGRSGSTPAPRDDYYLDIGAQAFRAELAAARVPDERIHFELFPGHARRHRPPLPAGPGVARPSAGPLTRTPMPSAEPAAYTDSGDPRGDGLPALGGRCIGGPAGLGRGRRQAHLDRPQCRVRPAVLGCRDAGDQRRRAPAARPARPVDLRGATLLLFAAGFLAVPALRWVLARMLPSLGTAQSTALLVMVAIALHNVPRAPCPSPRR